MIEVEQLSLFTMLSPVPPAVAVCCMDLSRVDAAPAESWMFPAGSSLCWLQGIRWCSGRQMALQTAFRQDTGITTIPSENACSRAYLWEERG